MLRKLSQIAFVIGLLTITTLSVLPAAAIPVIGISDKLEHMAAYAALALAGGVAYRGYRVVLIMAAGLLLLGMGLEFVQAFIPSRSASIYDGLANTVGIALGSAAAISINMIMNRHLRILE